MVKQLNKMFVLMAKKIRKEKEKKKFSVVECKKKKNNRK